MVCPREFAEPPPPSKFPIDVSRPASSCVRETMPRAAHTAKLTSALLFTLILRGGLFHVVDNDDLHIALFRFEFKPELRLKRGEESGRRVTFGNVD